MKLKHILNKLPPELRRDAQLMLAHLLKVKPPNLHLLLENELELETLRALEIMLKERKKGVPTAYIIGEWDFFGRTFKVERGILIPRPETELLVEKVLERVSGKGKVMGYEIGSGTGCISITLLLERSNLSMLACDINPKAVGLTLKNAKLHGVKERLQVFRGKFFEPVKGKKFDFIVSNPPYIPEKAWNRLPAEVRLEGREALLGGIDGYEFYKKVAPYLKEHLKEGGFVAFEIGHDQGKGIKKLLREIAGFKEVIIYKDYSGQDRIAVAWN